MMQAIALGANSERGLRAPLDHHLDNDLVLWLRDVSLEAPRLGLDGGRQWELQARLSTARQQIAHRQPSMLLLRIALLSLRSLLLGACCRERAEPLRERLDQCLRRLPG